MHISPKAYYMFNTLYELAIGKQFSLLDKDKILDLLNNTQELQGLPNGIIIQYKALYIEGLFSKQGINVKLK